MTQQADGRYDHTRPWDSQQAQYQPLWSYLGPFTSNAERLAQDALQLAFVPGDELLENVRPPLDMIVPFPPRYGYRQFEPGIMDILNIDQVPWNHSQKNFHSSEDFSGSNGETNSSTRFGQSDSIGGI